MKITKITIRSFGVIVDREFHFAPGANVIEGGNESGKTSLAAFIKFALYGLDGKKGSPTEKERYINRSTGRADGAMEFVHEGKAYRIERAVGEGTRETKSLVDLDTLSPVKFAGEIGEYLFGVPESVFLNTAFIRQSAGSAVDSEEIKNAVANILSSADEKISVEKIVRKLDAERTKLKHKNNVGGRLRELERQIASAREELDESRRAHASVIEATGELREKRAAIEKAQSESDRLSLTLTLYDDMRALEKRSKLEAALGEAKALKARLDEDAARMPAPALQGEIAEARAGIKSAAAALERAKSERDAESEPLAVRYGAEERDADRTAAATLESSAASKKKLAAVLFILGAVLLAGAAGLLLATNVLSALTLSPAIPAILGVCGAAALAVGAVVLSGSRSESRNLGEIYERWGVDDGEALLDAIENDRDAAARESARAREYERAEERVAKSKDELSAARSAALALCAGQLGESALRAEPGDALDLLEAQINDAQARHAALEGEYRTKVGECRAMDENLRSVDFDAIDGRRSQYAGSDEWNVAAGMTPESRADAETKRRFFAEKIRALEAQCDEQKRIAYSSPGKSPAQIEEELSSLQAEKERGELRLAALELAMQTVEQCGEKLRQTLIPGIVSRASASFAETTAMRHDRLAVDGEDFSLRVSGKDGAYDVGALSTGGADAAYVCLRRALTPALYRREAPPAIYDESFSAIDEERAARLLSLIAADEGQSLIFTCRASDAERAAKLSGAVNVIRMGSEG